MITRNGQANKEKQMTAAVILNVVFAVLVVVGMLTFLGRAILADHRATGARLGVSRGIPAVRPRFGA
jgi:hypothetical protein